MKKMLLVLLSLGFVACSNENMPLPTAAQKPQKMQEQKVDKMTQTGTVILFQCKDDKQVRAVYTQEATKNKKTLNKVSITYNDITQKLTLAISERGKNYTNIHWQWKERIDYSSLTTTVGETLAEQCVKIEK